MSDDTDAQIESARRIAVALEQQVARVLEIHRPVNAEFYPTADCGGWGMGDCGHDDCPTEYRQVCGHCVALVDTIDPYRSEAADLTDVIWPCVTATALGVES